MVTRHESGDVPGAGGGGEGRRIVSGKQPVHRHDCENCTYLGTVQHNGGPVDLYHCLQAESYNMPTVIARYGEDGDYTSGVVAAKLYIEHGRLDHPLVIALERAKGKGLRVE